jgi:hypothetical protein
VAFGWRHALAGFEFGQPRIRFCGGKVQPSFLIMIPGSESILAEPFTRFLALNVLLDGFAKNPVWRSAADGCQTLDPLLRLSIEFEACGRCARHE